MMLSKIKTIHVIVGVFFALVMTGNCIAKTLHFIPAKQLADLLHL
jgi:hypothetical protein